MCVDKNDVYSTLLRQLDTPLTLHIKLVWLYLHDLGGKNIKSGPWISYDVAFL